MPASRWDGRMSWASSTIRTTGCRNLPLSNSARAPSEAASDAVPGTSSDANAPITTGAQSCPGRAGRPSRSAWGSRRPSISASSGRLTAMGAPGSPAAPRRAPLLLHVRQKRRLPGAGGALHHAC